MSGGGTQQSLRKALGALKDSTTVGLAKVNSDFKDLDVAIVKATNHVERPAKEKHIQAIFSAISASRPRADVAYCIHALARRLSKTHNWAADQLIASVREAFMPKQNIATGLQQLLLDVALKTLIVVHRALREVDPTFREELINYSRNRGHVLNLSHFKDDSSPNAWDYSAWIRVYALFLEERLECLRVLKYDIETDGPRTKDLDTVNLLDQLPAMQQLLHRLLACLPQGAAVYNFIIQLALSMVAQESMKIYNAISDGTINLIDKFFEMQRLDAVRALDIYRRAGQQAESLSKFYEVCKGLDVGRGEKFIKIQQPPASFLTAMEDYVKEAPRASSVKKDTASDGKDAPKVVLSLEYKKLPELQDVQQEKQESLVPSSEPVEEPIKTVTPKPEPVDLLGLNDPSHNVSAFDEKNALALAIVPADPKPAGVDLATTTGWELALVTTPSSNGSALVESKLAGGLDKLTLDSLYDDAISKRANQNGSFQPNPFEMQRPVHDPFYASNAVAPPHAVQMAALQQQQAFMFQQQQQMMLGQQQQPLNPFGNPRGGIGVHSYGPGMPVPAYGSYGTLI